MSDSVDSGVTLNLTTNSYSSLIVIVTGLVFVLDTFLITHSLLTLQW